MKPLLLLFALAAAPSPAADLAGVNVPGSVAIDGGELRLNGAGLRRATMFNVKVYVGALYLTAPSTDPELIVRGDAPKSVHMTFLRDVDQGKVMDAFREGFDKNSPADAKALLPALSRVATVVPKEMKKGMQLAITYVPGKGTTVTGPAGEVIIEGKPFADAMFRNWLGPKPADEDLKKSLLGLDRG